MLILEIHKYKSKFKHPNKNKTRSTAEDNLIPNKHNTTLMGNLYVNKGIKLVNKLPNN